MPILSEHTVRPLVERFDPRAVLYERVNLERLQALLLTTHGANPFTLTALTEPTYKKTGCPYRHNLFKLARVNGLLNWDYQRAVNRQRIREDKTPDFESLPRAWGTHLTHTPFISHVTKEGKHKLYLKVKVQKVISTEYRTWEGAVIPESQLTPWLIRPRANSRQGIDKEVIERDYEVNNILSLVINEKGYVLTE